MLKGLDFYVLSAKGLFWKTNFGICVDKRTILFLKMKHN